MKRIVFFTAIFFGTFCFKQTEAQGIGYDLNISKQPLWGPIGFDHVEYYYIPDIECYYDVPHHQFIYQDGKKWVRAAALPAKYKNYDLYKDYKVVINQPQPYRMHETYRKSYARYKGKKSDPTLRDKQNPKPHKVVIVPSPITPKTVWNKHPGGVAPAPKKVVPHTNKPKHAGNN